MTLKPDNINEVIDISNEKDVANHIPLKSIPFDEQVKLSRGEVKASSLEAYRNQLKKINSDYDHTPYLKKLASYLKGLRSYNRGNDTEILLQMLLREDFEQIYTGVANYKFHRFSQLFFNDFDFKDFDKPENYWDFRAALKGNNPSYDSDWITYMKKRFEEYKKSIKSTKAYEQIMESAEPEKLLKKFDSSKNSFSRNVCFLNYGFNQFWRPDFIVNYNNDLRLVIEVKNFKKNHLGNGGELYRVSRLFNLPEYKNQESYERTKNVIILFGEGYSESSYYGLISNVRDENHGLDCVLHGNNFEEWKDYLSDPNLEFDYLRNFSIKEPPPFRLFEGVKTPTLLKNKRSGVSREC